MQVSAYMDVFELIFGIKGYFCYNVSHIEPNKAPYRIHLVMRE